MTTFAGPVTLTELDPRRDERWAALASTATASVFTSPPWLRAISETYPDFVPSAHVAGDGDGAVLSGVVTVTVDDALGRRRLGLPFSDYADLIVSDREHVPMLLAPLLDDGVPLRLRVRDTDLVDVDHRLDRGDTAGWHSIAVDADDDELWARLGGSSRRNARKARASGIEIEVRSDLDAMRRFYDLHVGVRLGKYGLLPQPRDFFDSIHQQFAELDAIRVVMARHGGRDVAGIVVLVWDGVAYYKFNASSADALALRPNDLLMWETMLLARGLGCRSLDLGISDLSQPGLLRYKRKFAAEERVITTYSTPSPPEPAEAQLRTTLGDLTQLLADPSLPAHVAPEAGRLLYRFFA